MTLYSAVDALNAMGRAHGSLTIAELRESAPDRRRFLHRVRSRRRVT